ncbi:pyridoxamine 5'-phosphate oxidase family protein [Massilia antarctica]|uniref:Pyridoxamine 5'-phosphate oxidase family protein n=1 Tax=Massilia antarctica TaxID=2765360 RepID=A0AA48WFK5_9BURK|nr:pyridoxamine 5'-phosphate oxidase family protein [Massilia antarctica]
MHAQDILPDDVNEASFQGLTIRKGTVAAFLANARAFADPALADAARAAVQADIEEALPALRALGVFDVFEIRHASLRALIEKREPAAQPDLDALYAAPSERIQKAVLDRLVPVHEDYLGAATFFALATGRAQGLDVSPRGGPPGFVKVIDARTLAFADWPGNNRIESMRNLADDERAAMLFLFPGLEVFMRINGRARVSTDAGLLATLAEGERLPKAAIVVAIDEVLMHCGKAVNRARLWREESRLDRAGLPTVGQMLVSMAMIGEADVAQANAHYEHAVRNDLY